MQAGVVTKIERDRTVVAEDPAAGGVAAVSLPLGGIGLGVEAAVAAAGGVVVDRAALELEDAAVQDGDAPAGGGAAGGAHPIP